jgi:outer membrane protein assembly factor BamB
MIYSKRFVFATQVFWVIAWTLTSSEWASVRAADWPQFLGPQRNGVSAETGLLDKWPEGGPKQIWRTKGGVGMSGLAISGGKLVTLVQKEGQQWLIALDAATGKPGWQTPIAPEYKNQQGDGPRATPTIVGDLVFAYGGDGTLAAVSLTDGKPMWSHNVVKELGGTVADYGMASSPLVLSDLVMVTAGAPQAAVAAYRVKSGELAWKSGDDPAGYSSPALLDVGGRKQLVVFTGGSVLGLMPETGAALWRYPYETDFECNIAAPLAYEGQVFVSSGENHGCVLLKLKPAGDKLSVEEVWQSQGKDSVLRNEWQTSIQLGGYLYGFDNSGSAGPITNLTCISAATGERAWQQPRFGKGNMIAAEGKLFMTTMAGELVVARASPKSYDELGRKTVFAGSRQAPALAGGLLYLRDNQEIVCVDVRKP